MSEMLSETSKYSTLHTHLFVLYDPYEVKFGEGQSLTLRDIKVNIGSLESPVYGTFSVPDENIKIFEAGIDSWNMPLLRVNLQNDRMYSVCYEGKIGEKDVKTEEKFSGAFLADCASGNDIAHTEDRYRYRRQFREEKEITGMPEVDPERTEKIQKRNYAKYAKTIVAGPLVKEEREITVRQKDGGTKEMTVRDCMFNIGTFNDPLWIKLPIAADLCSELNTPGRSVKMPWSISLLKDMNYRCKPFRENKNPNLPGKWEILQERMMKGSEIAELNNKNRNELTADKMNRQRNNAMSQAAKPIPSGSTLDGKISSIQNSTASEVRSAAAVGKSFDRSYSL